MIFGDASYSIVGMSRNGSFFPSKVMPSAPFVTNPIRVKPVQANDSSSKLNLFEKVGN